MKKTSPTRAYFAAAVRDAAGIDARPGVVVTREGRIVAAGRPDQVDRTVLDAAEAVHLPDRLILPGMVNAHTHLELTSVGPRPYSGSFTGWVRMLLQHRARGAEAVRASAARGAELCKEAGVVAVGDIGGGRTADAALLDALAASGLGGVCFGEFIAYDGEIYDREVARLRDWCARGPVGAVRLGIQPHAPYSTSPRTYDACTTAALSHGLPLATHLAEMTEEAQFVARADGPFRAFLEELGVWQDRFAAWYDAGRSPVQWMRPFLERAPWLVAHCNYVSDDDIAILRDAGASVAYCPIASEYFGHHADGTTHRYRDMLAAGVNVCLGTDSIVCQPPAPPEGECQPMSILAPMRRLYRRDGTPPEVLLRMATVNGARALRMEDAVATLQPGAPAVFCTVPIDPDRGTDPLAQALENNEPVRAVWEA